MKKIEWDYKVVDLYGETRESREEKLKQLGKQGWGLVSVAKNGAAYLKKRKDR